MGFKEMVEADIYGVFINGGEFADTHNLDGVECLAVVEYDQTKKRSTLSSRNFEGLHGDFVTVAVKRSELARIPAQGQNFKLDGKLYKVISTNDDMGVLTIELGAYRMGGL